MPRYKKLKPETVMTLDEVAAQLGVRYQGVQVSEQKALYKLREALVGDDDANAVEEELLEPPLRTFVAGRWNGKKIVAVR